MFLSGRKLARENSEVKASDVGEDIMINGSELAKIHHKEDLNQDVEESTM